MGSNGQEFSILFIPNLKVWSHSLYILEMYTFTGLTVKAVRHIVTNGNVIKLCSLSQVGDKERETIDQLKASGYRIQC